VGRLDASGIHFGWCRGQGRSPAILREEEGADSSLTSGQGAGSTRAYPIGDAKRIWKKRSLVENDRRRDSGSSDDVRASTKWRRSKPRESHRIGHGGLVLATAGTLSGSALKGVGDRPVMTPVES